MLTFLLSIIINLPIIADNEDFIDPYNTAVQELDTRYGLHGKDVNDLSYIERDRYYEELESLKATMNDGYKQQPIHKKAQPGDIYLTSSSETLGIRHGHAAINSTRDFETIESDNLRPVSRYPNQVNRYWKITPNSKRYQVIGTTEEENKKAAILAEQQVGKPYCFNPLGDDCYFCTKLIWAVWDGTGAKNKVGHYYLAPDMMKSKSLKLAETYMK